MTPGELIVVGASAGGLPALADLLAGLPTDLPAAVIVHLHSTPHRPHALRAVLARRARLPVQVAEEGTPCCAGRVYVCPPGARVRLGADRTFHVETRGGRTALDELLESAAGPDTIGVLLSGSLDCGVAGLRAIKARGGVTVVQDPADAQVPFMPAAALRAVEVDYVAPAASLGAVLGRLAAHAA